MLKDTININTYLNAIIFITLTFFGYVGFQYDKRFDRIETRMESGFNRLETKIDNLVKAVNQIQVNTAKIEERQNHLEYIPKTF